MQIVFPVAAWLDQIRPNELRVRLAETQATHNQVNHTGDLAARIEFFDPLQLQYII